jgi:hypothetical protein
MLNGEKKSQLPTLSRAKVFRFMLNLLLAFCNAQLYHRTYDIALATPQSACPCPFAFAYAYV